MSGARAFPIGAEVTLRDLELDPHPALRRLRAAEPVSWLPVLDGWLVTGRAAALRVMRDPGTFTVDDPRFSTARVIGPSMLSLDGDAHARHRDPFARAFRPARVRAHFTAFVEAEVGRLLAGMRPAGRAELRGGFAGPPAQLSIVKDDPGLLPGAIEESLRLEPAAAVVDRYATRDVRIGDAAIRRGDLVRVSITAANRDPEVFPDPDRFDVRRSNATAHLAFAHGPHFCFGAPLARLETQIALRGLLDGLPGLALDGPCAPEGLVFRKPPEIHVRWGL